MGSLKLEQVLVFSRHGIRTPLPVTIDFLNNVTPKQWPKWDCNAGYLTTRGGTLESYFGDYFAKWLNQQNFDVKPQDIYVYANSLQRTVATAQYFTLGAFAGLDIPIHHQYDIEQMDPVFNPIIRDSLVAFNANIMADLKDYTESAGLIDNLNHKLMPAYQLLADILDYKNSNLYQQYQCDFAKLPTTIDIVKGEQPILKGPLAIGTAVANAFTLQYYSAFKPQDIAWGMIEHDQQWQIITDIKNQYINLLFKSLKLASHIARPLISFIDKVINADKHKLIVLVGHDSNIAALLGALRFKQYQLPAQFEQTPIGGKVVFCRLYDQKTQQHYFKAQYIYQTFEQLHLGAAISLNNPPKCIDLVLADLKANDQGLYLWQDVKQRVHHYLASC